MKCDQGFVIDKPFHSLQFYLPRAALDAVAERSRITGADQLACQYGIGHDDAVTRHVGALILEALRRQDEVNQIFIDRLMMAFTAHVARNLRRTAA